MPEPGAPASSDDRARAPRSRFEFLLNLSDTLGPLTDPAAVAAEACRLLGEALNVDRAFFAEADGGPETAQVTGNWVYRNPGSLAGKNPMSDVGWILATLTRGNSSSIDDTQVADSILPAERSALVAHGIAAYVGVPLLRDGRLVGALCVSATQPRKWTEDEVELVREVGERVYAAVERARAEAAVRASEARYRTLFMSMDEGFCTIEMLFDPHGNAVDYRYLDMNPAFSRQSGFEGVIGHTVREIFPDLEAYWFDLYGHVAMTGEARRVEHAAAELGRVYDVFAFRVGEPHERHVAIIFSDITGRKQAEATIREMNRTLEQRIDARTRELSEERAALQTSNEELEAFNYSVSHDLMTPVRHVQGFAQLAAKHLDDPDKARRFLGIVEQGAQRMEALIGAMLTLSRTGRRELILGSVDLADVMTQAQMDVRPKILVRPVDWRIGPLPHVQGDRVMLQQVMTNLLDNAVKYTHGRQPAVIEVWAEEDAQQWTIHVRDNGAGFDPAYASRLFGIFQRLHRQDEFEGTGIGLSAVRRIIMRHGGTVSATGAPGQGATFTFTLPKRPA